MKIEITDKELKTLKSYNFHTAIYVPHNHPNARKILEELSRTEELQAPRKTSIQDIYLMLRLLGLKHLAYIFETPPSKPWNKTSKNIRMHSSTIYYYIVFPSSILKTRVVKAELNKLRKWVEENSPQTPELRGLVRRLVETKIRAALIKFPKNLKDPAGKWRQIATKKVAPKSQEQWLQEYRERYQDLKTVATALTKTLQLTEKYQTNLLILLDSQ